MCLERQDTSEGLKILTLILCSKITSNFARKHIAVETENSCKLPWKELAIIRWYIMGVLLPDIAAC